MKIKEGINTYQAIAETKGVIILRDFAIDQNVQSNRQVIEVKDYKRKNMPSN